MALNPGDASLASGTMAKGIYDAMTVTLGAPTSPDFVTQRSNLAAAIAQAVCAHIAAHADVRITTTMGDIQRSNNVGLPTLPPLGDVVLPGAVE